MIFLLTFGKEVKPVLITLMTDNSSFCEADKLVGRNVELLLFDVLLKVHDHDNVTLRLITDVSKVRVVHIM